MSETKHTPGPWRQDDPPFNADIKSDHGNVAIAIWSGNTGNSEYCAVTNLAEAMANARLIAAAPRLFEALKKLLSVETSEYPAFERGHDAQVKWCELKSLARSEAKAAIAKATGST